jgi:hypothetical protein
MTPIITELFGTLVKAIASEVIDHLNKNGTNSTPAPEPEQVKPAPVETTGDLRADCLTIINQLAPTHGKQLRAMLPAHGGKRLGEIVDEALPALLADLVALRDA